MKTEIKLSVSQFKKPTPKKARKIGRILAAVSTGITGVSFFADYPAIMGFGGFCFLLSLVIPELYSEES